MMRETNITEIINSTSISFENYLLRVHVKMQLFVHEICYFTKAIHKEFFVLVEENKIVGITHIPDNFQFVFNKLIQFIQINICKQLRGQVTQRQTGRVTVDYISQQHHKTIISSSPSENVQENLMINRIKKLFYVQFQNPQHLSVISRQFKPKTLQSLYCSVGAFIFSGRPRIKDKDLIPYWLDDPVDSVVEQSITHRSFVNMATFRIMNKKRKIPTMLVGVIFQVLMQLENVIFEVYLELRHIAFVGFFSFEFRPSVEQVLQRNNFIEHKYG